MHIKYIVLTFKFHDDRLTSICILQNYDIIWFSCCFSYIILLYYNILLSYILFYILYSYIIYIVNIYINIFFIFLYEQIALFILNDK